MGTLRKFLAIGFLMSMAIAPFGSDLSSGTPTTTQTTASAAAWTLKSIDTWKQSPEEAADWCYKDFEITISGLSATTYARCTWPSPAADVWNRTHHSWSAAPPPRLTSGEKLQITSMASTEGTYLTQGMDGGGSTWVRIDLQPGGGPRPGGGWANVTESKPSASAVSEFTIPSGSKGGLMLVMLKFQGPGGGGMTTYTYEWSDTGDLSPATPIVTPAASLLPIAPQPSPTSRACEEAARFNDFNGNVEIAPKDAPEDWDIADLYQIICELDYIKTGLESHAILSFADLTTYVMGPESKIQVSAGVVQHSKLNLVAGNIWMNIKRMLKDGSMEVKMSQAVAGIKGTTLVLEETGTESTLKVIEGNVEFTSLADGSSVMVAGGETVTASAAGLSKKTTFDVAAETTQWQSLTSNLQGAAGNQPSSTVFLGVLLLVFDCGLVAAVLLAVSVFLYRRSRRAM